ncbi:MAG: metal-dependent hydrolase [Spirochaetia bacterium]|nr:metal-dependent hydrolase [Spirochaetia bacterium]
MDILTHALSGFAVSTAVAACSGRETNLAKKAAVILCGTAAAILPDLDAASLWSRFDGTIGAKLALPYKGSEIYFGKYWYSHHAFMHSLAAGLIFATALFLPFAFLKGMSFRAWFEKGKYALAFFLGFMAHLAGDWPTPGSVWGGIQFLWPSKVWYGGTGQVWWWNNYDVFLLILGCCVVNVLLLVALHKSRLWFLKLLPVVIFAVALGMSVRQVTSRPVSFAYSGHAKNYYLFEKQSLDIQKNILGERIFTWMTTLDKKLGFYF